MNRILIVVIGIITIAALLGTLLDKGSKSSPKMKLILYGTILCREGSNTCFEVQPNKTYCFETVCFERPVPYD